MPPVVAAAVVAAAAYSAGFITLTAALTMVASSVLSYASKALAKKPKAAGVADYSRDRTVSVRQPITPWQVVYGEMRVGGAITYIKSTDSNRYLNLLITLTGHPIDSIQKVYFDDEELTVTPAGSGRFTVSGRYGGYAEVWFGYGDGGAEETALLADLQANSGGEWSSAHRQAGRAKLYVRLLFNQDIYPNGIPNISVVLRGRKLYDPRTATTVWSSNAALCVADYLTAASFGLAANYDDEIAEDALIEAANICDEDVALAAGGTENRYGCNGNFDVSEKPNDIVAKLLSSMAGRAVYIGGKWSIYAGAWRAPSAAFDETSARGGITVATRVSRRDGFNGVKGVFLDPTKSWQPTDFPPVTNATYLAEDNGERVWKDIDLSFTTSAATAQRLAKIELEKARQQITVTMPGKLSCYQAAPPDVVSLTNVRRGWTAKSFEVVQGDLVVDGSDDAPTLGYDMTLRETASSVYDWSSGEETTVDSAPDTDLPNPFTVLPPGAPVVTEEIYVTRDGAGVKAKASLAWAASSDGFLRNYQPEYKLSSAAVWSILPATQSALAEVLDINPGIYDFRVKAINQLGVSSAYSTVINRQIYGLASAPANVSGLTISTIGGLAILRWGRSEDLDVRIGGKVVFRHSPALSGALWQESVSIGEAVSGGDTVAVLPLKPGSYLAKFVDSSDVQSAAAASASTKQATALAYANVATLTESPTFGGAVTNAVVTDGTLQLAGAGMVDAIADIDAVANWDAAGGVASVGSYAFLAGFDFSAVVRRRLTASISAASINVNDLIDDRTGPIDTWQDFDGTAAASADAQVWVRHTDDNPAGAPAWTDWHRLDSAEFLARAFQFQCRLASDDPAYNIVVSALQVSADEVS